MPNGRSHKGYDDYGPHKYADHDGTSDCQHGCGCWAGPARSGGPTGISPFGHCPSNPLDGQKQSGNDDYEDCVNGRIKKLEKELYEAQKAVELVEQAKKGTKVDLVKELNKINAIAAKLAHALGEAQNSIRAIDQKIQTTINECDN